MDADELLPKRNDDPAVALGRQDLDPLSVIELEARIKLLETEISRTREKLQYAVNYRATADALFRR